VTAGRRPRRRGRLDEAGGPAGCAQIGGAIAFGEAGQATILVLGAALALLLGALVLGAVARGIGVRSDEQRAADLAALAGARAMHDSYPRLFEPAVLRLRSNPAHLERAAYLDRGRDAAIATGHRNGARHVAVSFPDAGTFAPARIRVDVRDAIAVGARDSVPALASAEAELAPPADVAFAAGVGVGEYRGPLAMRQGKPMRPDVAAAFDRMQAAAHRDGISLVVVSGFRSNAEQAALFARHPDPKWVAPPGRSLHRLGTELDLAPAAAYGWLAAHAKRFHFVQRYSWEPWHYGFTLNAGTSSVGFGRAGDGESTRAMPSFVPAGFAGTLARAAQRWNVSAALLGAQLYVESNFNPFARSSAGALGIAQFMPGTARQMGLTDPLDAAASIDAQAHLMRDLLRRFGAVPLALAAYNAGPVPVAACGCIPPRPETRGYVARVLGLLSGAGEVSGGGLEIRLVR
jgi:D-alanyl-D-alanine dipeptidase